jgi:SAM-dependent methyltransferase
MTLPPLAWHNRFRQQTRWTRELRNYLFDRVELAHGASLLEVGCGTGAVISTLPTGTSQTIHGLDINPRFLALAGRNAPHAHLCQADAHQIPYQTGAFALTLCHFVLLWLDKPEAALTEMVRVTSPGGAVMVLAEPDYGGRIDYPESLAHLGTLQAQALQDQGADPFVGRRLAALLHQAGLDAVESGVLGGQWTAPPSQAELALEWEILRDDLGSRISETDFAAYQAADREAWTRGDRILYVPTFYAWGRKLAN